jgi:hypothetical protein
VPAKRAPKLRPKEAHQLRIIQLQHNSDVALQAYTGADVLVWRSRADSEQVQGAAARAPALLAGLLTKLVREPLKHLRADSKQQAQDVVDARK